MPEIKLIFEKEGNVRRVSYLTTPTFFGVVILIATLLAFFLFLKDGFRNIPSFVYLILILLFLIFLIPQKKVLEFNFNSKILTLKKYGFIFYRKKTFTRGTLKFSNKLNKKVPLFPMGNQKINYALSLPFLFKTITPEQAFQISKFLKINPNLGLAYF